MLCRQSLRRATLLRRYSNIPKYDDAQILAEGITNQPYVAKRNVFDSPGQSKLDYNWDSKIEQKKSEKAYDEKMNKIMRISAVFQGLLFVGGLGLLGTLYLEWPRVQGWWEGNQKADEELFEKLKKRTKVDIPVVNGLPSSSPGLYVWGDATNGVANAEYAKKGTVRFPIRLPFFDGKKLRCVDTSDSGLAIDTNGDLIQWGGNLKEPQYTVTGMQLTKAKFSNDYIYALSNGELYAIPKELEQQAQHTVSKRDWLLRKRTACDIKLQGAFAKGERVADFDVGKDHVVVLTNKGRVFTAATSEKAVSKGQFGLPQFSQFDAAPVANKLYEVELLNKEIVKGEVHIRDIKQIACGNFHTIALDGNGEVYSWGLNTWGQLGQPISYNTEIIPYPVKVPIQGLNRDLFPRCTSVKAGGDDSFVVVKPQNMHKFFKGELDDNNDEIYMSFGNGLLGQLGNGHYTHSQCSPSSMKPLEMHEYADNQVVQLTVDKWSIGSTHTFVTLANNDVLCWGNNECGQLGNGKKIKAAKPSSIPALLEPGVPMTMDTVYDVNNRLQLQEGQVLHAGERNSCIYYK